LFLMLGGIREFGCGGWRGWWCAGVCPGRFGSACGRGFMGVGTMGGWGRTLSERELGAGGWLFEELVGVVWGWWSWGGCGDRCCGGWLLRLG